MTTQEEVSCDNDGCDHPAGFHKWEINPSPRSGFDAWVTDNDEAARDAIEMLWDQMEPGELVITIRMNRP